MVKVPKGYRSKNVDDRRGRRTGGGGGFGLPRRRGGSAGGGLGGGSLGGALGGGAATGRGRKGCGGGVGIVLLVVFALLLFSCLGGGGSDFMGDLSTGAAPTPQQSETAPDYSDALDLVNFVLDDVQEFWDGEFDRAGQTYPIATLVLFEQQVSTGGCGTATSGVGPFYCPADGKAYIDVGYMLRLQDQLGAAGDFSQAYILAHEIGHHVQNVLGTNEAVRNAQSGASRNEANALSVRMELQADCLAGMWARNAEQRGLLEAGDLDEGVNAASAVGDDAITGSSNQENFTHGTSAQRIRWFTTGFDVGEYSSCDTFAPSYASL